MSLGIPFEFRPSEELICAGSLNPEALRLAQAEGVIQVINLCPHAELDWDEAGAVHERGMTYHNIPVSSPADLSDDNAQRLLDLLDSVGGKTLLHCASSNRVGALLALAAQKKGASVDEALALGEAAGLTRMGPIVAQLLAQRAE